MTPNRNLKKIAQKLGKIVMIAVTAICIAVTANAQKPKLAVMDFMAGVGLYQKDVDGLSDMLINSLFNTGKFELIERGQPQKTLQQHFLFVVYMKKNNA